MDIAILNTEVQDFIDKSLDRDISKLALEKNPFPDMDWFMILNQIEAKSKSKSKLPTWFSAKNIIYPTKVSIEQTSSEGAAAYKASLVSGETLIDITGGFGIDAFYFSKKIKSITHCEIDSTLSKIVKHNFDVFNINNIVCHTGNSSDILANLQVSWDWIYVDPSRRNSHKNKVFLLKDCEPNIVENLDFYFKFSKSILLKTAPLLDITAGLQVLKNVKEIHIVAINNEVKELLWVIEKDFLKGVQIKTIHFNKEKIDLFDFEMAQNNNVAIFEMPQQYLYEPNSAIMKSGGFNAVSQQFGLSKLHKHTHLYTAKKNIDFPGRIFKIDKNLPFNKDVMKQYFEKKQANISCRNFPENVENVRKKWKIKDGGNQFLFFTTNYKDEKIILVCSKIN